MARAFVAASEQYLVDLSLALTEPYSFGGWVYPVSTTDHKTIIAIVDASKDTHFHQLRVSNNDDIGFRVRQSNDVLVTTSDVTLNTWNHALGVAAASNDRRVYLDGGSKATSSSIATDTNLDATGIGITPKKTIDWAMDGYVAEAFLYNIALTDADALILAAGYSPLFVKPENLVAYWPLIRDEDQDRVGGYDLTPISAPTITPHPPVIYPAPLFPLFAPTAAPPAALPKLLAMLGVG